MTFTTTFLRQMNLRPLAGLTRIERDCMMNGGSAVGHIGIKASGTLLFLSFLSCVAVPSLFVLLCSRPVRGVERKGSLAALRDPRLACGPMSAPHPQGSQEASLG